MPAFLEPRAEHISPKVWLDGSAIAATSASWKCPGNMILCVLAHDRHNLCGGLLVYTHPGHDHLIVSLHKKQHPRMLHRIFIGRALRIFRVRHCHWRCLACPHLRHCCRRLLVMRWSKRILKGQGQAVVSWSPHPPTANQVFLHMFVSLLSCQMLGAVEEAAHRPRASSSFSVLLEACLDETGCVDAQVTSWGESGCEHMLRTMGSHVRSAVSACRGSIGLRGE